MRKTADSLEDQMQFINIALHEFVASSLYIYSIYIYNLLERVTYYTPTSQKAYPLLSFIFINHL